MTINLNYGSLNSISMLAESGWESKGFLEKSVDTLGAAGVDLGVSMWNSVANVATLGSYEDISTRTILQDMNAQGSLSAYDNNRDAVELLSFIGGVFIPAGAAIKLSRGIRAGLKGTNFLSPMRHQDDLLKLRTLVDGAQKGSAEFKALKRSMFLRGQAENAMDTVAAEIAILGTLNAHPYMEDYLENPVENFAISLALGAGIGGAVSHIFNRVEINRAVSAVEQEAQGAVTKEADLYQLPFADSASAIMSLDLAEKNLRSLANQENLSELTKQTALKTADHLGLQLATIRDRATGKGIGALEDKVLKDTILGNLRKPEFLGASKIDFFTVPTKSKLYASGVEKGIVQKAANLAFGYVKKNKDGSTESSFKKKVIYNPEVGAFVDVEDALALANAAEISSLQAIKAAAKKELSTDQLKSGWKDVEDFGTAGDAEVEYLKSISFFDNAEIDDLVSAKLIETDLAAITGWTSAVDSKIAKLKAKEAQLQGFLVQATAPEDIVKLNKEIDSLSKDKIKLENASLQLVQGDRIKLVDLTEVQAIPTTSLDPMEIVKPTYFEDINREITGGSIKPLIKEDWMGGGMAQFQQSASITNEFYKFLGDELMVKVSPDMLYHISPKAVEGAADDFVKTPRWAELSKGMVEVDAGLSETTKLLMARWIAGNFVDKEKFRNAVASARTMRAGAESTTPYHNNIREIMNSPYTLRAKEALSRHGNAKGDVFIYRGTSKAPQGDTPISSYTFNPVIAQRFGTPHTYSVKNDDILTYLYKGGEEEWLIGASTRDAAEASVKASGKANLSAFVKKFYTGGAEGRQVANYEKTPVITLPRADVKRNLVANQVEKFGKAVRDGVKLEVAAMRYNINPEFAPVALSGNTYNNIVVGKIKEVDKLVRWNSPTQLQEAFSPLRRQLSVIGRENEHMGQTGLMLEKHRQYLRDLGATRSIEKFVGPVLNKTISGESKGQIALKLGLRGEASDIEIAAALQKGGYSSYTTVAPGVKGQPVKRVASYTREEKGVLEKMVDTEGGQRVKSKIAINESVVADINRDFFDLSVLASSSGLAKEIYREVFDSKDLAVLRESLKEAVSSNGGNSLTQSADFLTSTMDILGPLATRIGDLRVHVTNQRFNKLVTPVTQQFDKMRTDLAARTEFAYFDNLRQSTKGLIRFDPEQATFVSAPPGTKLDRRSGAFIKIEKDAQGNKVAVKVKGEPITDRQVGSPVVAAALQEMQKVGDEIFETQTTVNRVTGKAAPADIGFWMPSTDFTSKARAYVLNLDTGALKLLVANTQDDLQTLVQSYAKNRNEAIRYPSEIDNLLQQGYEDGLEVIRYADVEKQKKGIGLAVPDLDPQRLSDIIERTRARMNAQASSMLSAGLHDVMTKLDGMSYLNQLVTDKQGAKTFKKAVNQISTPDTARDLKAILTGNTQIGQNIAMSYVNNAASLAIHYGVQAVSKAWHLVEPRLPGGKVDFEGYQAALRSAGIDDPYKNFHESARALIHERNMLSAGNVTPDRVINTANSVAATLALKFGELAQPLVNMLSLPILMTSTVSRSLKSASIRTSGDLYKESVLAVMYNGVRRMNSGDARNVRLNRLAADEGLFDSTISEVDEVLRQSRVATGGALGQVERVVNSSFVQMMSKPSEWAEGMVRRTAFNTAVETAIRTYGPQVSDKQILIFSRDFMKQAIGNYSTSQRPMMFQGTFGAAMGLFQTYMLTYAQNMYRHVEIGDKAGLGKTLLAQAGIFGAWSLPGFQQISNTIGEHFSDDNIDLNTGLFRALPDDLANIVVYGMPSAIGPAAVHTRGDVNPRIPTGFDTMVAPSMIAQLTQSLVNVGQALFKQDMPAGQAFFEALSTQSVSRPIARWSELFSGSSVTGAANQIAGPEEVWSWQGVVARAFATRTLKEVKAREAIHLNSYYGSINAENRQSVLETLRANIRAGEVTNELMDDLAFEYLRTGSPQGFRQAVNQAFMEQGNEGIVDLSSKLGDSSLMYILDDTE